MFQSLIGEDRRRTAGRAAGDFFSFQIAWLFDLLAADEGLQRFGDGEN